MKSTTASRNVSRHVVIGSALAWTCLSASILFAQQSSEKRAAVATSGSPAGPKSFNTPQDAAAALISAAEKFDVPEIRAIFGTGSESVVLTGEDPLDKKRAADFAAEAHEKQTVSIAPKNANRAYLLVGNEDWPFPVPIVKKGAKWSFDAVAGRQELLYRRIGANELDVIAICHNYVDAQ